MAVRQIGRRLYIEFRCRRPDGRRVKCTEATGLPATKRNEEITRAKDRAITYELKHGRFSYLHFFPHGSKARIFRAQSGSGITLAEWWDAWLAEKSLRRTTERGWNSAWRKHIGPALGHLNLSEIDAHQVLMFRRGLEASGLAASSINDRIIKPLCMCLLLAQKRGLISQYPCSEVRRLAEIRPEIEPFTPEELSRFLATLEARRPMYHDMLTLWVYTGLRPGELFALKWRAVDWFNGKLLVRETRTIGIDGPPKTAHSSRDMDMLPPVVAALRRQEARTGLQDGYVFLTEEGKPFSDAFFRKKFRVLTRLASLKHRPPKQMRHTFATLAIAAGENISWVSRMLGHSSVEITLKRYNRFVPNLTRQDGSVLLKALSGAQKGENKAKVCANSAK